MNHLHLIEPSPKTPTKLVSVLLAIAAVTILPATATWILAVAFTLAGGISPMALAVASWFIWGIAFLTVAVVTETRQDTP